MTDHYYYQFTKLESRQINFFKNDIDCAAQKHLFGLPFKTFFLIASWSEFFILLFPLEKKTIFFG